MGRCEIPVRFHRVKDALIQQNRPVFLPRLNGLEADTADLVQ